LPPETRSTIIAELEQGYLYSAICSRHGVSKNAVSKIAIKAGFRRKSRQRMLTDAQEAEIVSRYQAGEKAKDMAASFGISHATILETLWRCGAAARPPGVVPLPLRHAALDVLTPGAAYWCGIFFTDGTVVRRPKRQPEVAVVLQRRDYGHLVKLRDFLGATNAITPIAPAKVARSAVNRNGGQGKGAFRFCVSSRQLGDRIEDLGRYEPPIDPELAASRDFWRGAIDGDGTVGISCGIPQVKLWGTHWLLSAFVDFLGPVSSRRPLNVQSTPTSHVVSTSYATAAKIVERLYAGASVALDRKAATAKEILSGAHATAG
jgi:transposase-like protein